MIENKRDIWLIISQMSFAQLMGPESPEDIERSSDDIRDILEQDIAIPFDFPTTLLNEPINEPMSLKSSTGSTRTAPTLPISSGEHSEDGSEENAAEQSGFEATKRQLAGGQRIIGETAVDIEEPELGDSCTVDQRASQEKEPQALPIPVARAKRGLFLRATTSAPSRRTRTVAFASRPKPIETISDNGEENSNNIERQARATIVRRMPTSQSKGRPRKVKEEQDIPVAEKNSKTTRSAIAGDGRKSLAAAKVPATRTSGRRPPATAPSGASVADERENRDEDNPRHSKAASDGGANVKITRNRKAIASKVSTTSKTVATTRIKVEDEAPRRSTRARTRTKT